ncbi:MAG: peptidyl-prolyl cis-trans isomerase [Candidatus Hinthialibacter antarcticus]|nr:peptidyl-prolyl cis-trans isomerase [Candidatus Hinthialibacter antarcticus]
MLNKNVRYFIGILIFFAGCYGPTTDVVQRPEANSVAFQIGDNAITTGEVLLTFQETRGFVEFQLHFKKGSDTPTNSSIPSADIKSATHYLQTIAEEIAFETMLAEEAKKIQIEQSEPFQKKMEDVLRDELYQKVIIEDVLNKINISDDDIQQYYQQYREDLFLKENTNVYKVRGIYVYLNQEGRSPELAREKMQQAYQALKNGEPFASVSRRYSEAPANMRGVVNPLPLGSAAAPIEQQLRLLSEGGYSPIFEYKDRLYIFELVEFVGADYLEYEAVHDLIMQQLFDERRNERVYDFSQRLQTKHNCLINEDLLKETDQASPDTIVLSVPDVYEITLDEFNRLAIDNKKWTFNQKSDYLNFLANKASCLAEAYDRGWSANEVEGPLSVWRRKRLAELFLKHEAEAKLPPEAEIKKVFDKNYGHPNLSSPKYYDLNYLFFDAAFNFALTSFESSIRFQNAEGKAHAALQEIETGRPFSEVAVFFTNDEASASTAGRLGRIPFNKLNARLQSIIGKLDAGEVSRPEVLSDTTEERFGIELFYVKGIEPPRPYTFEEAKPILTTGFIGNQYAKIRDSMQSNFINSKPITPDKNGIQNAIQYLSYLSEKPDRQVDITYYAQTKKTTQSKTPQTGR